MEFHMNTLFFITICLLKLVFCQETCSVGNLLINNPTVLKYLNGIFYRVYKEVLPPPSNQIVKFKQDIANHAVIAHTIEDSGCCKSISISTILNVKGYYNSTFSSLPSCATQFQEQNVIKTLFTNAIPSGGLSGGLLGGLLSGLLGGLLHALLLDNLCVIMWVCRPSVSGVQVYCKKPTVSLVTSQWVQRIGAALNITFVPGIHNKSYQSSSCIANF